MNICVLNFEIECLNYSSTDKLIVTFSEFIQNIQIFKQLKMSKVIIHSDYIKYIKIFCVWEGQGKCPNSELLPWSLLIFKSDHLILLWNYLLGWLYPYLFIFETESCYAAQAVVGTL